MPRVARKEYEENEPVWLSGQIWYVFRQYGDGFVTLGSGLKWHRNAYHQPHIWYVTIDGSVQTVNGCQVTPVSEKKKCILHEELMKAAPISNATPVGPSSAFAPRLALPTES